MDTSEMEFDITKHIKIIEQLKCEMLSQTAELHMNLIDSKSSGEERENILVNMILTTYLLANRLNIENAAIEHKMINKLRVAILEEKKSWMHSDLVALLRHIDKKNG